MNDLRELIEKHAHADCVEPPSYEEWSERRAEFSCIYRTDPQGSYIFPDRFKTLERELERCYCSGAFVACVILSKALYEAINAQFGNDKSKRDAFWSAVGKHVPAQDQKWLADQRNAWAHAGKPVNCALTKYDNYVEGQHELKNEAVRAMRIAFAVGCEYAK